MTTLDELLVRPCSVVLVGFGIANRAVAAALVGRGHTVTALDDRPTPEVQAAARRLGVDLATVDGQVQSCREADFIVPTPGLPEQHPAFAHADEAGTPVVSELDLAAVWDERPVLAVTGTNGKTTTVELAVAALAAGGREAVAAGNTDIPLVAAIDDDDILLLAIVQYRDTYLPG